MYDAPAVSELQASAGLDRDAYVLFQRQPVVGRIIHDTLYEERKRLERESRRNPRRDKDRAFNERARHRVLHASEEEQKAVLREQIEYFVEEVAGKFNPRVYDVATRMVPRGLALLMNALSPMKLLRQLPELPTLDTNVTPAGSASAISTPLAVSGPALATTIV